MHSLDLNAKNAAIQELANDLGEGKPNLVWYVAQNLRGCLLNASNTVKGVNKAFFERKFSSQFLEPLVNFLNRINRGPELFKTIIAVDGVVSSSKFVNAAKYESRFSVSDEGDGLSAPTNGIGGPGKTA